MGFFMTATLVGWFVGPIFGGTIQFLSQSKLGFSPEDSYRIPYFMDSLLSVIALVLVNWKVQETRGHGAAEKRRTVSKDDIKLTGSVSRSVRVLYITELTNGFAVGFIAPVGVLFLSAAFGAIPFQIGAILSVSGFVGVLCNFFAGKMADTWSRKPVIAIGSFSSRLAAFILPYTLDLWQATGVMAACSLGLNIAMPATRALRADLVPAKIRGKLFGRFAALFNVGMVAGSLLGPWLFDTFMSESFRIDWLGGLLIKGVGITFFLSGTMGLIALALLLVFVKEPSRKVKLARDTETLETIS